MNLRDDAGVRTRAPEHDAVAGESRQSFDARYRRRTQQIDTAIPKIAFVVERAGIAVISRRVKLGTNAKTFAVSEVRRWNRGRERVSTARIPSTLAVARIGAGGVSTGIRGCGIHRIFAALVDGQPDAGVHRPSIGLTVAVAFYRLRFHVDGSSSSARVGRGRAPISLSNYVSGQRDALASGKLRKM